MRSSVRAAVAVLLLTLSGCAHAGAASSGDPLKPLNEAVFSFNQVADRFVIEPVADAYGRVVPDLVKQGARNFFSNLQAPIVFANDVLQGEGDRAGETFARFFVNTTLGLGGLFDMATMAGLPEAHDEDFGQTLAVWGVGPGPYLVLPLLGPSNLRDLGGRVVDIAANPTPDVLDTTVGGSFADTYQVSRTVFGGVDTRHQLDPQLTELERTSLDLYASFRTLYEQTRERQIRNGASVTQDPSYEDIFDEDVN